MISISQENIPLTLHWSAKPMEDGPKILQDAIDLNLHSSKPPTHLFNSQLL